jgi:hypothetical protein
MFKWTVACKLVEIGMMSCEQTWETSSRLHDHFIASMWWGGCASPSCFAAREVYPIFQLHSAPSRDVSRRVSGGDNVVCANASSLSWPGMRTARVLPDDSTP